MLLTPSGVNEVYAFLQKNYAQNQNNKQIAQISQGNIGTAIRLINDEEFLQANQRAQKIVEAIKNNNADRVFALINLDEDFLTLLEDKIYALFMQQPEENLLRLKAISDAKTAKKSNGNKTLIQQKLAYELVKGGIKWQK